MDLQSSQFSPRRSGDSWMSLEHGTSASTPAHYTTMWKTLVSDAIKNAAVLTVDIGSLERSSNAPES